MNNEVSKVAKNNDISGIINILKPPGMTSHDVVGKVRRIIGVKKAGHSGTLDPEAAGVLPVFIGRATRLLEYTVEKVKFYRVEFQLGFKTDTGDDSGKVIKTAAVPNLSTEKIEASLANFIGEIDQIPPMYSALKVNGKKLYQYAREGKEVERAARKITISKLSIVSFNKDKICLDVECSQGTYIRTLIEDIAEKMGTYGSMTFLLRTQVGPYSINDAVTFDELEETPNEFLLAETSAIEHLPKITLTDNQAVRITQGVKTTIENIDDGFYAIYEHQGTFLGIAEANDGKMKAHKILYHHISQLKE